MNAGPDQVVYPLTYYSQRGDEYHTDTEKKQVSFKNPAPCCRRRGKRHQKQKRLT
ncbi:hypothetical protein MKJ04_03575 [Pontibacter sp. E15-1]|uniref:hypothetical protein n=1 Tax=Pontibacter sp. E15-1 TaxID=2919918 RepID=UPI001F4FA8F4|nr:hypothetical protein [Pontibacter sp. E15-1]MCJ8163907.1 hypothetical protein [Pontibacter sp. E15-1]